MSRGSISHFLRKFRLIYIFDKIRFFLQRFEHRATNQSFQIQNPDVALPPDYLMYESFQINYGKYFEGGIEAAQWLISHLEKHIELKEKIILDWGCGPGRVIRHLPDLLGNECEYHGTDHNTASIDWCKKKLSAIHFNNNELEAELPYDNSYFDVIFGISVLTHLSETAHHEWLHELRRILKPGGILFLTAQGNNFKVKLTTLEARQFDRGDIVVRGKTKHGHRTYSAFHPTPFMVKLFEPMQILEHVTTPIEHGKSLPQDIWMVQKTKKKD
ncbi:MAG: class I SAM-dependent methyltransferase [Saprospiraceae bacterium]|nr:class I SAM-dependent methyltransferase [Saprospiraceae bacterium]